MEIKSEIAVISNKYHDIFDHLIDNSDTKSLDLLGSINKGLYNSPRFKGNLISLFKEDHFNKNIFNILLRLVPKI